MSSKTIFTLNLILILVVVIASVALWGSLPRQIPIHFTISGEPDRWVDRSFFSWYLLPLIALGMIGFFHYIIRFVAGSPQLWNIPNREVWLALTPEQREPVIEAFRRFMAWTSVRVTIIMSIVQASIYLTAVRTISGLPWYVGFLVLGLTVYTVVQAFRLQQVLVKEMERAGSDVGEAAV